MSRLIEFGKFVVRVPAASALLAFVAALLAPVAEAPAAPSISSTSGTFQHGNSVTISGSSFGSKSTAAPIKWDDFEDGVDGTYLESVDSSWVAYFYGSAIYNNDESHSGSLAAYNDPFSMSGLATNYFQFDETDEVYVAYWVNITNAESTDYGIIKLTRITSSVSAGGGGVYNGTGYTIYSNINPRYGSSGYVAYNDGDSSTTLGYMSLAYDTWLRVEMYKKVSTAGIADGDVEAAVIGYASQIHNDIMTRASGETFLQDTVILGLMAANGEGQFEIYIDDVYIDNTRARAEIGDAATWSNCDHKEVQIASSWSSSSITATVNEGSFTGGQQGYLYVVDANGNVNASGYPVTIGDVSFTLTVTNGSGSGEYDEGEVVAISANPAPSGKAFAAWAGDFEYVADRLQASTTVTMPATDVSLTAVYVWAYQLTVNSGAGDGQYPAGTVVNIEAGPAPTDKEFGCWTGETANVAAVEDSSTTVTMPSAAVEITATYTDIPPLYWPGDVNQDFFVGGTDLDIVLGQWGRSGMEITDLRADVNEDLFVGGTDLDYILADWGKSGSPPGP